MKIIQLTRGRQTMVDDEDYLWLSKFKWQCSAGGYAVRTNYLNGVKRTSYLHIEIMSRPKGKEVDHIDGDTLNNQKSNLRICSHQENGKNLKVNSRSLSGLKGVWWNKKIRRWQVYIHPDRKHIFLGTFGIKEEAAQAYNSAAIKYFGKFARLNII